jgi:methionyl-tRNA formyltransferase
MVLRLVFMGTPAFSVPTLAAIIDAGHEVVAVYSQPPRRSGRGMAETKGPVHAFADSQGIPVFTPLNFKAAADREAFAGHQADAAVVVAYGLLLPQVVLDAPRLGCYNLHASALPRWRGAAPIHRAIMAGDTATAAIVMRMEAGLDTGPMCRVLEVQIAPEITTGGLHDVLSVSGAQTMVEALASLEAGTLVAMPQPLEGVTYASKIEKREARLDFTQPAATVHNVVRGLSPFPGAWFEVEAEGKRERIKVLRAHVSPGQGPPGQVLDNALTIACGDGAIQLVEVQRAGKRPQSAGEFQRGFALKAGTLLVSSVGD